MRPSKICFCVDHWPTFFPMHGPVRYVQTLARGLVARGVEVHVVTAHPTIERSFVEEGYHVHARRAPPLRVASRFQPGIGESLHLWRAIRALHQRRRFDVVELTNVEGVGFCSTVLAPFPTVIRVHTTAFDAVRLGLGKVAMERGYARFERWTAHRADVLVTHTKTHQARVADDYGIPAERIHVVPHGIVPAVPDRVVTRRPHQVVTVGSASARKGVGTFLEAADLLAREIPDANFIWAGKDTPSAPNRRMWSTFAAERYPRLAGRFELRGGLSDAGIASLYAESGVYLCTSLYESFGLTLVEAMFASLPVVAPRTAAMAELVHDGENGWLYEPGGVEDLVARVRRVLDSPAEREAVATRARRLADQEYTADRMTSRMLDLYRAAG
jgi:glycosyltransferase involved in cell wall biosynthesis